MPRSDGRDRGLLRALELQRGLALEAARAMHAERVSALAHDESVQAGLEAGVAAVNDATREHTRTGGEISAELLRLTHDFVRVQTIAVTEARAVSGRTQGLVAEAQDQVARCLEESKAIERLREKRGRVDEQRNRRRAQWRLDELGLIKGCNRERIWP